jgi:hypothetical protein
VRPPSPVLMLRLRRCRLIALVVSVGIIVPTSGALVGTQHTAATGPGGIGVRLVGVTADARDPLARSYVVEQLKPGESISRIIQVSNTTHSTANVIVYPAAAMLRDGNLAFAPGQSRNQLSDWTSVSRGVLLLPPGATRFETVTITVPKEASPGERYAVVWVAVPEQTPPAYGIRLVNRVGIRMYISIGTGGVALRNFAIGPPTAKRTPDGTPIVVAHVRNSGQRTLDISGTLTLSDGPGGLRAGPFPVELGATLLPGISETATVPLDRQLPRGPWLAQIRLHTGQITRSAAATITFPRTLQGRTTTAKPGRGWSFYLLLAAISLVTLLAATAVAVVASRRAANS